MQAKKLKFQQALANVIKKNRKNKSITQLSCEIELSKSIWADLEKGKKDIQLSTFWRISEAINISPKVLIAEIEEELGDNFSFIED